jgi:hypothetical protein
VVAALVVAAVVASIALFAGQRQRAGQAALRADLRVMGAEISGFYAEPDTTASVTVQTVGGEHQLYCEGDGTIYGECDGVTPVFTTPAADGVSLSGSGRGRDDWCVEARHDDLDQVFRISALEGLREDGGCG